MKLSKKQIEAILYCIDYAMDHDDEGIRCSDPEAVSRTKTLDTILSMLTNEKWSIKIAKS